MVLGICALSCVNKNWNVYIVLCTGVFFLICGRKGYLSTLDVYIECHKKQKPGQGINENAKIYNIGT